jgi:hypothetical protein
MSDHDPFRHAGLDARLAALPRELPPARDLWSGVDAALVRTDRRPRRWPLALAAGVVVAALGAVVGARVAQQAAPAPAVAAAAHTDAAVVPARLKGAEDADYLATRSTLERTYRERIALLAPATRARIEEDLVLIQRAHQDIQQALTRDPSSRVLLQLLQSTTEQEISLYSTVGRNTEPFAPRTRT